MRITLKEIEEIVTYCTHSTLIIITSVHTSNSNKCSTILFQQV